MLPFLLLFSLPADNAATVIVPLKSIYASLLSHKIDFSIEVLNLIWLLVLYVPRASSFKKFLKSLKKFFRVCFQGPLFFFLFNLQLFLFVFLLALQSHLFVFWKGFPNREYVNLAGSIICLWLESNISSAVRYSFLSIFPDDNANVFINSL